MYRTARSRDGGSLRELGDDRSSPCRTAPLVGERTGSCSARRISRGRRRIRRRLQSRRDPTSPTSRIRPPPAPVPGNAGEPGRSSAQAGVRHRGQLRDERHTKSLRYRSDCGGGAIRAGLLLLCARVLVLQPPSGRSLHSHRPMGSARVSACSLSGIEARTCAGTPKAVRRRTSISMLLIEPVGSRITIVRRVSRGHGLLTREPPDDQHSSPGTNDVATGSGFTERYGAGPLPEITPGAVDTASRRPSSSTGSAAPEGDVTRARACSTSTPDEGRGVKTTPPPSPSPSGKAVTRPR